MPDNPLTKEQIEEINKIAQLPAEEQKVKLNELLKKLTPEQIEFLKGQQGGGCVFCGIADGKVSSKKVYEDDYLIAVLDINPANKGHVLLFPKVHYEILSLMDDVSHLFNVANRISSVVFDVTNAEGTNILVANGLAAGQKAPHISVHIIPRFKNDKVQFAWEGKEVKEEEMTKLAKKISAKLKGESAKKKEIEDIIHETDYIEERRIP